MDLRSALAHKLANHLEVRIARQAVTLTWSEVARIRRLLMIRTLMPLEGVTRQLQVLPPAMGARKCRALYGHATFVLKDETGSLPVLVLGSCNPSAVDVLPKDGDRVRLPGLVQVLKSDAPRDVRVQATQIQSLESH